MSADNKEKICENHLRKSAMRSIRVISVLIFVRIGAGLPAVGLLWK